jgi:hypothetical protein
MHPVERTAIVTGKILYFRVDDRMVSAAVNELIDEHRVQCLWFLRENYYPSTLEARIRTLGYIERHGSLEAFRRAAALKRWLSRASSG